MILLKATIENSKTGFSSFIEHETGVIVACGKALEGTKKELESAWEFHVEEMPEYKGEFSIDYTYSLNPPTVFEKVKCFFGIHKSIDNHALVIKNWYYFRLLKFPFIFKVTRWESEQRCILCNKITYKYNPERVNKMREALGFTNKNDK